MKLTKVEQIKENLASIKCKANAMKESDKEHAEEILETVDLVLSFLDSL